MWGGLERVASFGGSDVDAIARLNGRLRLTAATPPGSRWDWSQSNRMEKDGYFVECAIQDISPEQWNAFKNYIKHCNNLSEHLQKKLQPIGIGIALRTKINANLGNSALSSDAACEIAKVQYAVKYGADTVMDLSTGADIDLIRQRIIDEVSVPVGTVPLYQVCEADTQL